MRGARIQRLSRHELATFARKLGINTAIMLGAFAVLYWIGVNLLLSTGGLAHLLSGRPDRLHLELADARTLWPGKVRVQGLDLRGRDSRLEWSLHIDSADADISLLALLRRRFHVESVVANGVTFRARFRLEPGAATADRIARIPPIDGFDPVPLLDPLEDMGRGSKYTVELENVEAKSVREVWIDSFRLAGDMAVAGGFQLGPDHRLEVTPSWMTTTDAALTVGTDAIVTRISGAADAVLAPVNLGEVKGAVVLRSLSSHSGFSGQVGGMQFLRHFMDDAAIELEGGDGSLVGQLVVEHGVARAGSAAHLELGPASLVVAGRRVEARSVTDVVVRENDAGERGELDVTLSEVAFSDHDKMPPTVTSSAASFRVRVAGTDFAAAPRDFTYDGEAPRIEVADLRVLEDALPKEGPFHIDGGKAIVTVRGHGSKEEATADVTIASTMSFRLEGARAAMGLDAKVRARSTFREKTIELSGTAIEMKDLAVGNGGADARWWGKVELGEAEIDLSPPSFAATMATSARDARPLLTLYGAMRDTSPAVTMALAVLPDPFVESMTSGLRGSARVHASKASLELHGLDVEGAASSMEGELTKRGDAKHGGFLFAAGPASAGVAFDGGKASLVLFGAPRWFATSVRHEQAR